MVFFKKKVKEQEGEKKPRLMRRTWLRIKSIDWKNPLNRWRLLFGLLFFVVFMSAFTYGALALTSTPAFCSSCHEMAPEHVTFTASAHSEIKCTQCHIPPGAKNLVIHKVKALKEVYYHFVGPPDPIVQTDAVLNISCLQCHSENRLVSATGDLIVNHEGHIEAEIPCITCHSGVVHAKVVERGLNTSDSLDYWTEENADKLIKSEYLRPNMGTCIDCHDKVNNGEEPWRDIAYSLPKVGNGHGDENLEDENVPQVKDKAEKTENIILQAIGKQKQGVELSMECQTCHQEVSTPKHHQAIDWDQNHGKMAIKELDKCMDCHQEAKWIKEMPKESIESLIHTKATPALYKEDIKVVKAEVRENPFCSTCHAERPPNHLVSEDWLTSHAVKAETKEEKAECFVCHDRDKETESNAPTDVYCQFCHRTGFKDDGY